MSGVADAPARPKKRDFNRAYRETRLPPDRARRQWLIVNLAYALLGDRDQAIAFLNSPNETLGGRPLDLAIMNEAGYVAVEGAICLLARPQLGGFQ